MKLIYTDSFSLGEDGVLIQKGVTPGNGVIPKDVSVKGIFLDLTDTDDQIAIKGTHASSAWANRIAGDGWGLTRIAVEDKNFFYVKSVSGTITVTLSVEGT